MAGPAASEDRLDRILRNGLLRVCMWPEYYAISYRNPRTGELQGLDIDLSRALAGDLGAVVGFVESSFPRFAEDLRSDRCDIGMFAIGVTPARSRLVAFSRPYLRSGIHAVTTRTHPRIRGWADLDQEGMVIAVQEDTYMDEYARGAFRRARVVALSHPQAREEEVQSGRADAFLTDYPYGQRMLAFHPWAQLIAPDGPVQETPYAYAVAPDEPAWLERVDRFVAAIKRDGRLEAVAARYKLLPIVALD